jgi:uncharacterized membrane protein SpoIIM required for sporulation
MALIKCPECGNEVSDRAKSCPKCGFPTQEEIIPSSKLDSEKVKINVREVLHYLKWPVFLFVIGLLLSIIIYSPPYPVGRIRFLGLICTPLRITMRPDIPLLLSIVLIFLNNLIICLALIGGGIMGARGILLLLLIAQGFALGFVFITECEAMSFWSTVGKIIPHNIFKIPCVLLAGAIGFGMASKKLWTVPEKLLQALKNLPKLYLLIILLLSIAAIIETLIMHSLLLQ